MKSTRRHDTVPSDWMRQFHEPRGDGLTLVCFPHAGGSASAYFSLSSALSATCHVLVAQYPGRQDRLAEPAIDDLGELADRAAEALEPWRDRPLALFGHSMGAAVAYEVARRLERRQGRGPLGLIVSGRAAPSVRQDRGVHRMDDAGITAHMAELAGTPPVLLADKEFLATAIPPMRADLKAVESYQDLSGGKVTCPISSYCGEHDTDVPRDGVLRWREHTTARFTADFFEGGHFYLQDRQPEVVRAITRDLAAFTSLKPTTPTAR
ncbi:MULTISPECIES: thioesterase II family protein [Streptomyces]|uniref:thioesterase II family protein n=1 Tax=Streptomyces TaxID=1883 RepID=UPI001E4F23E1|nr:MULTISPECIES: alpha/beta fold hydrolase [Streptomyces]UFQ18654.1 alpha/beta fold hydrolase [Streptomyces huasconensis]WCL88270.1 alpha/beta fold hydrolase [Streptomyces sp. JCM 35825]